MLTTILKPFDTFVFIATTSTSIILSLSGIGLIAMPISSDIACGLTIRNKVIYEIVMQKYIEHKKQNERDQQTNESFNKLYRKSLQDKVFDKNENESLCSFFTGYVVETRIEFFYKHQPKNKIKLFQ